MQTLQPKPVATQISTWGEAPIWHNNSLLYIDIHGKSIHRFTPSTQLEESWPVNEQIGTVIPTHNPDELIFAGENGISRITLSSGKISPITNPEPNIPDNRFNDGKCSPDGILFAGTISRSKITGAANLYRITPNGSSSIAFPNVTNSNGIVWSPNTKSVFYIDTPRREVILFDYQNSQLLNPRTAFHTNTIDASPDGMSIDTEGNLWIAFCHGGKIARFTPQGELLLTLTLPCAGTTAVAFGGENLTDLYITTGRYPDRPEPLAGRLFVVKNSGFQGLPTNLFGN